MTDSNHQASAHPGQARRRAAPSINHSRSSPRATRRPRYNPDDWERRKAQLEKLYKKEGRTLPETMKEMEKEGFHAEWVCYYRHETRAVG